MKWFLTALQFLTILRTPGGPTVIEADLGKSMSFFPLVGLLVGLLLAGISHILLLFLPRSISDIIVVIVLAAITGCLHLDGFADTIDGLAGGKDRERTLAIMKDSRIGSFAVVGLILLIALKISGLMGVPEDIKSRALIVVPVLGRWATVQLAAWLDYARAGYGTGLAFTRGAGKMESIISTLITAVILAVIFQIAGLLLLASMAVLTLIFGLFFRRRIGGVTGDIMGASCEFVEAASLLFICAIFVQ